MENLKRLIKLSLILSLLSNQLWAQHDHHHASPPAEESHVDLKDAVLKATEVLSAPVEVSATPPCGASLADRPLVNFDPKHLEDEPGFHGMLFFGAGETFYISHLPMFHKPHDYQAIVEVRLDPKVKAKYQAELKKKGGYFTFSPDENFVLPKVMTMKEKASIPGTLVQGHFERGGVDLTHADLEIVRVVFYKKIDEKDKRPPKERYAVFGKGDEFFMVHEVFQRPNVDEIIPLPKGSITPQMKAGIAANGLVMVDDVEITEKSVQLRRDGEAVEFPYKEFYRETGDLE